MDDADMDEHIDALAQEALSYSGDQRRRFLQDACPSKDVLRAVVERMVELNASDEEAGPASDAGGSRSSETEDRVENAANTETDPPSAPTDPAPEPDEPSTPAADQSGTGPGGEVASEGGESEWPETATDAVKDSEEIDRTQTQGASPADRADTETQGPDQSQADTRGASPTDGATAAAQEKPPSGDAASTMPDAAASGVSGRPEQVGAWRLLEPIGRGGMGTVYRAERADGQFQQQAALKLIRHDLGPKAQRRFLSERQILAQLQHPNIAHLLDGGVTDDGRPYFAMEYVDGTPIDTYCNDNDLGVEERLRLFQQICEAVQFAHSNLIVHRDLKPGNILVAEPGTETGRPAAETTSSDFGASSGPQVKLLDFGIAKALEGADGIGGHTQTGEGSPMTPSYATPEQVEGAPVTTATDVYAMGLVLCELLTGSLPYDVRGRSPVEAAQAITEAEPKRLSQLVDENSDSAVVEACGRSAEALRERLSGDLDVIVQKALRKDPDRRYTSATNFGQDVDRHLEGLPVEARPATTGYRLRRFVSRNRATVLSAAGALVALLIGLGVAIWQAQVAAAERDRAQQLAEEAQQNAERAEAVQTFLLDMFEQAGPARTGGEALTVQEVLDDATAELESETLQDQPHTRMEVRQSISDIYLQLSRWEPSIEQARKAYETGVGRFGPTDPKTLRAGLTYAVSYTLAGRFARADSIFGAIVPRLDDTDASPELRFDVLSQHGGLLRSRSRLDSAETTLRRSLEWYDRREKPDPSALALTLSRLGVVYRRQRRFEKAEETFQRALDLSENEDYSTISTITQNLGNVYKVQGQHAEAEKMYRRNLEIKRRLYGEESIATATAYMSLSSPLRELGKLQEADSLSAKALSILQENPESSNFRLAFVLLERVKVLKALGRYEEAIPLAEKVRRIFEAIYDDPTNRRVVASHQVLANLYWQKGRMDEAAQSYEKALTGNRALLDSTTATMATYMSRLGAIRTQQGRYEEAEELLLEARSVQDDSAAAAKTRERLSDLYEAWPGSEK